MMTKDLTQFDGLTDTNIANMFRAPETTITPQQYADMSRSYRDLAPEEQLALAVLIEGLHVATAECLSAWRGATAKRDAMEWLMSDTDDGIYAFRILCERFNLDPDAVRLAVGKNLARASLFN